MPFDGRVIASDIELGQTVSPNMAYGTVYPVDAVEIVLSISTEEAARLAPLQGRSVTVHSPSDAQREWMVGTVTRVAAELDDRTRLVDVVVQTEPVDTLLPGSFINARIRGERIEQAYWLPAEALNRNEDVWIVDDGLLQSIAIEPLMRESGRLLTPAFPFAEGVVITPPPEAAVGLAVQALNASPSQAGVIGVIGDD